MRTLWRGLVRIVFWSFERGTLPYDVAVGVIVLFVLFSPRSWFDDRPRTNALTATTTTTVPAMVEFWGADPLDGAAIYRVDARLISQDQPDLAQQLHEAVRKHANQPPSNSDFEILRVAPVRAHDGTITHYDVCVKP